MWQWVEIPDQFEYARTEAEDLAADLERAHSTMLRTEINDREDILLKPDGRLRLTDNMLTLLAVKQMCTLMAAGLWQYVADVGGIVRRKLLSDEAMSPELAINTLNSSIDLRAEVEGGLVGRHMICDTEAETVDGIVGAKYQYLAHTQLYEIVSEMLLAADQPSEFYAATRIGRLLAMDFLRPINFMNYGDTPLFAGHYFRNSEAGEGGVKSAIIIQVGIGKLRCMSKLISVPHVGRKFTNKLGRMLASTTDTDNLLAHLQATAVRTLDTEIPLITDDNQVDGEYRKSLVKHLNMAGADNAFVESVIAKVELLDGPITVWNVFYELIAGAVWLHPTDREKAEHVAFQILTGTLKLEEL